MHDRCSRSPPDSECCVSCRLASKLAKPSLLAPPAPSSLHLTATASAGYPRAGRWVQRARRGTRRRAGSLLISLARLSSVVLGYSRRMRRAVRKFRSQTRGGQRLVSGQLSHRSCYCFCEGISAAVGEREGNKEQGNSDKGRTTRPHARTTAEKQGENRRTELGRDSNVPETPFSHLRACAAQSGCGGKVL